MNESVRVTTRVAVLNKAGQVLAMVREMNGLRCLLMPGGAVKEVL